MESLVEAVWHAAPPPISNAPAPMWLPMAIVITTTNAPAIYVPTTGV